MPLFVIALFFSGCTTYLTATIKPQIGNIEGVRKRIPLKAALYVSDSTKAYIHTAQIPLGGWRYPFGKDMEDLSYKAFSQVFDELRIIRDRYNVDRFDIVIEPKFNKDKTQVIMSFTQIDVTTAVVYDISDSDGVFWQKEFVGKKTTSGATDQISTQGEALSGAIESAALKVWHDFNDREVIARLRTKRKVASKTAADEFEEHVSNSVPVIPVSDIDVEIPKTSFENRDAIAIVIGNRDYKSKDIPAVDFAVNDAQSVKNYLINVLGYRDGNISISQIRQRQNFEAIFGTKENYKGRLYNYLKKGKSDIFIFYSGHGAPDPDSRQGYFVPVDADPQIIGITGYSLKQLYDNVAKIAKDMKTPNVFIMVDACFSGVSEKGLLLKNASPITIEVENPIVKIPNAVVITSSSGTEVSSWYPEKGHSMFTYLFLKALKDEVEKGNGTITVGEIFDTVVDETEGLPYYARRLHSRIQTPQLMGDKNIVFVSGE